MTMRGNGDKPCGQYGLLLCSLLPAFCLAGCSLTPSVDVLGSFFPAWLICIVAAIVLTSVTRLVLMRLQLKLDLPGLAYPSLAAFLTFALWLLLFY